MLQGGELGHDDARAQPAQFLGRYLDEGTWLLACGPTQQKHTVVHIHPVGPEPTSEAERGGPVLPFKFYPPAAGYYRIYTQVAVDGAAKFPSFGVVVLPAVKNP